jgi:hypothetical protein
MKKAVNRILKITLLTLSAGVLTIAAMVLFPQHLFAGKMTYGKFTVYANSKMDNSIKTVLDRALTLVERSELFDAGYTYNIIFCNNSFYNKFDDMVLGVGRTARATLKNVIVKVRIDPEHDLAFPTFHKACQENLSKVIAHEMIHCLQAHKYGILKFNPFRHPEFWKLEGYPEYIATYHELPDKGYGLSQEIARYINLRHKATGIWILSEEGGCEVPDYYYKGRLMMEYLMDIRHLSYDQILRDTASEDNVYREMVNWNAGRK